MKTRELVVGAAVVVAVFAASPLHLPLNNPNEGVRVFAAKALVEDHTFAIDHAVAQWGYIDDKAQNDGRLYSSKAPLVSMLGAAAYFVVHPVTGDLSRPTLTRLCRGAGDAVPSLFFAFLLLRGLRRRVKDEVVADVVVVAVVLGSGVLASINVFSGHALAALGPAAAIVLLFAPAPRTRDVVLAGLALGAAVAAEYPSFLACAPIAIGAVVVAARPESTAARIAGAAASAGTRAGRGAGRVRSAARVLGLLVVGALGPVLIAGAANAAMFGAPWRTGYSFLENRQYQGVVAGTFFGIGAPDLGVLARVLVSPDVGLFFYSPFLVAGAAALVPLCMRKETRALGVVIVAGVLGMLAFIAGFRGWRGGWSVGPRYITEVIGLLALPTALAFDALTASFAASPARLRLARIALVALVMLGLLHSGVAGMFFPHLSDVFGNPVYEMMLPVVARGFAPDSFPLWLGMPPRAASIVLVLVLFAPLVLALLWPSSSSWAPTPSQSQSSRARSLRAAGTPGAAVAAVAGTCLLALLLGPHAAADDGARTALEARRMLDNWRPDEGNAILEDAARDPHALVAVDRARVAWPIALASGCAPLVHEDLHGELAPLALELGRSAPGTLVVLPDRMALELGGVRAAPNLFVVDADVAREGKRALPCNGNIFVVRASQDRAPLPAPLRSRREVSRKPIGAAADGLELIELKR